MKPLVVLLVDELVMSPTHARRVLKLITGCIGDELAAVGTAQVTGLGTFAVERRTVKFRAAKGLREKLNPPKADHLKWQNQQPSPRSSKPGSLVAGSVRARGETGGESRAPSGSTSVVR